MRMYIEQKKKEKKKYFEFVRNRKKIQFINILIELFWSNVPNVSRIDWIFYGFFIIFFFYLFFLVKKPPVRIILHPDLIFVLNTLLDFRSQIKVIGNQERISNRSLATFIVLFSNTTTIIRFMFFIFHKIFRFTDLWKFVFK